MPPSPDSSHRKTRKSKPKFEIPVETEAKNTPVGWVFRDKEEPLATVIPIDSASTSSPEKPVARPAAASVRPEPAGTQKPDYGHPLLMAGAGFLFIGVSTVGIASLLVLAVAAAPLQLAKGLFSRAS